MNLFYEVSNTNLKYSKMMLILWYIESNRKLLNNSVYLTGDFGKVSELVRIAFGCM